MPITLDPTTGKYNMTDIEQKAVLEEMEREYTNALNVTQDIRRRWWLVERYLEGNQWSSAGQAGYTFLSVVNNAVLNQSPMEVNVDENIVVDNLMLRIHMTNMARLCRYKPQLEISPNEKSKQNNVAVRKGKVALYDLLYKNNWIRLQQSHARHLNVMGLTFLKVSYDPNAGKQVAWPIMGADGQVARNAQGEVMTKKKPEGEVKLAAVNPNNLQFPSNCTSERDADWIQESNIRSTGYVKRVYNVSVKPEAISAYEKARSGSGEREQKPGANAEEAGKSDSVIVKERWYRPCEKYPEGAIVVWVKERLLVCKSLLKWYPDLPYFASWNIFNDESIYSDAPAYHLIQHQNEVNRTESNIARHVNLVGKPKLLVHRDGQVSDKSFTTDTGEIVEWNGDKPPAWLLAPPVSQSLYEHVNRHVDRMMTIGSAHDIMRPSHSRSGNAIAYEQEIDENTMAPMVASMTDMLERGLGFALQLMARYYKVPRMVKMLDSNAWVIEKDFKGDDLFGNFDVRINFLSGLPANKLAANQFITQMFEKGLLDKPLAQKYLEVGDADAALREQAMEAEYVETTIKTMERGATVPPHEWDNHALMARGLMAWLKENALGADPKVVKAFEDKLKWHQEFMALQAHPANAQDGGAGLGGDVPRGTGGEGPGLAVGAEAPELGGAPSVQEGEAQPDPDLVLQSGPEGR